MGCCFFVGVRGTEAEVLGKEEGGRMTKRGGEGGSMQQQRRRHDIVGREEQ